MITGGTRGIGLGIARQLAQEGCHLVINGVRPETAVVAVLEELRALGSSCVYAQANIGDAQDREALLQRAKSEFGRCNVLINNAGVAPKDRKDVLDATEESFDWVMNINLKGPYFLTQALANWLIEQRHADPAFEGCIVNVSSISADVASINRGEYCLSKAGLHMATKLFATRLGPHHIRATVDLSDLEPGADSGRVDVKTNIVDLPEEQTWRIKVKSVRPGKVTVKR